MIRVVGEKGEANGWWEVVVATGPGAPSSEVMDAPLDLKEFERGIIGWW